MSAHLPLVHDAIAPCTFPSGWYAALLPREVKKGRPTVVRRFGRNWAFWRNDDGSLAAIADRCPHRGASLGQGRLIDNVLECPFHGFRFGADGRCVRIPAHGEEGHIPKRMRSPSWQLREQHDYIWLWHGEGEPQGEPDFFEQVASGYSHHTLVAQWDASLSRCIENQLDYTHLPFVHGSSIGRRFPKQIEVTTVVEGRRIRGSVSHAQIEHFIELHFPNVWLNPVGRGGFVQVAFVPIDEFCTRLYVRTYQRWLRLPGVRQLVDWVMALGNRYILNQDRRVVERQLPRHSPSLGGGEVLLPSDGPIIAYRKLRDASGG